MKNVIFQEIVVFIVRCLFDDCMKVESAKILLDIKIKPHELKPGDIFRIFYANYEFLSFANKEDSINIFLQVREGNRPIDEIRLQKNHELSVKREISLGSDIERIFVKRKGIASKLKIVV